MSNIQNVVRYMSAKLTVHLIVSCKQLKQGNTYYSILSGQLFVKGQWPTEGGRLQLSGMCFKGLHRASKTLSV